MREKARQNLEAARLLLERGLFDALLFRQLRRLRIHADFEQGPTEPGDLEGLFEAASRFISETLA